jgi:hypothetical protein
VQHSVHRWPQGDQAQAVRLAKGDTAQPGDIVRTGWFGQTILSVPERNARFEVYANTSVRLAEGEPGVLMLLEHGRIKAFFEKLLDGDQRERRIAVPGALLAVRGTRYGVEVDRQGKSTLVVFEGVVEVIGKSPGSEPILVRSGQWSRFGPEGQPKLQPAPLRGFGERSWSKGMRPGGPGIQPALPGPMAPGGSVPKQPPHDGPSWHH